jgi:hypothetical protein
MATTTVRYFYQTSKSRFGEHKAIFDSKTEAYGYIKYVAYKAVTKGIKLHLWVDNTTKFYQVDVDKTCDGWVAMETTNKGTFRMVFED